MLSEMHRAVAEADKKRIFAAFESNEVYVEVTRVLGVERTTAWAIVWRFQTDGQVLRPRGGARENVQKINEEMHDCAVSIVQEFPAFTLSLKLKDAPAERNNHSTKPRRQEYGQWMLQEGVNQNLFFCG